MYRQVVVLIFFLSLSLITSAQQFNNTSEKQRLNNNWQFVRTDLGNVWEAVRPAKKGGPEKVPIWEAVTLPHSYNARDAVDPDVNYYQGPAWYKTLINIENPYKNGRTFLHFEGAGQKTEVYIYTTKVGSHVGGYDEWKVDVTDAIAEFRKSDASQEERFEGKIPLVIRTDNSRDTEMIPSDLSDFNLYGGIYRYLNLVYTPSAYLENAYANATVGEKGNKGKIVVTTDIDGKTDFSDASFELTIADPSGNVINKSTLKPGSNKKNITFDPVEVEKPQLWSPDSPDLYTCNIELKTNNGTHKKNIRFGFRHFEFKKDGPFYLNGERLLLRGTHRHEDHAGVGPAMTEEMIRREMLLMKEMGVNFIRLGHYQQSRIVLDLCDSLGILVWEEIPWCRGGLGGEVYKKQSRRMLRNMITQHRNHPSVIIWGLGNENDWPNDFPEFDKQAIRNFMKKLNEQAHKLDPTRVTAIRRCGFCKDIVDVYSPSIWAGWYRGRYTDYKRVTKHEHEQVDRFLHVEWGGDNHARRHAEDPLKNLDIVESQQRADERAGDASLYGGKARASKDGEWTETYICDLIDWHLKEQETMPWLSGTAYWPFKDFSTPIRPENPVPYVNQKGVVERDLTPKEGFYVFQSYWTEKPMIHIYGHTWPVRWGNKNEEKLVRVYSNCNKAELFVNGKSMGTKQRDSQDFPAAGLHWDVVLKEGKNTFKAIGYKGNTRVSDSITQEYQTDKWGQPAAFDVKVVEANESFVWVEARLKDKNNVLCLDSRNYIHFDLTGDGKLIDNLGTSTGSRKVQAYNGRAKIKVQMNTGKSVVSVKSVNCKTKFLTVE